MSWVFDASQANNPGMGTLPMDKGQSIRLFSFGPLCIQRQGKTLRFSGKSPQKALLLLKTLIACGHMGKAGYNVEAQLWPFVSPESAKRSLVSTTRRLRDLLDCHEALIVQHGKVFLNPEQVWNDTWVFDQILQGFQHDPPQLIAALLLYQDKFLPGEEMPGVLAQCRDRLHYRYLNTVIEVAQGLCDEEEWTGAKKLYQQALRVDDVSEAIYQGLIRCYRKLGKADKAIALFARCERTLREKLSISPSKLTRALADSMDP